METLKRWIGRKLGVVDARKLRRYEESLARARTERAVLRRKVTALGGTVVPWNALEV